MYLRTLKCLTCALLLRNAWSKESSRHKLKVHSPDETEEIQKVLEIAANGTISDARLADDRPVMRREQQSKASDHSVEELLKAVEDAKEAASVAATAAAETKKEMEMKSHTVHSTSIPRLAPNVAYATEVFVTEHPTQVPEAHPTERPFTSTTTMRWRHACPDNTRAPRGTWVVYNLSSTPILHSCLAKSLKQKVPDECCQAPGTVNMVGATFEELYFSNDYGSCVTLTAAGPLAGATAKVQCNSDNSVTLGESCDQDCSCKFQDVYSPGCYRASDTLPGTAWFIVVAGCDCTEHKAVVPHQFSLPPMQQNVGAADILNVGPEEAAKALNRQRQQLRAYYDEMVKDERVMTQVVNRLASGKPIADAIFGMDTGEIPEKVTKRTLDAATKDPSSAKYSVNATVSIMGHALATLKSGKPLADAVFGGDTSHLIQPHLPTPSEAGTPGNLPLPKSSFKGKFPDFKEKEEPVERLRFSGDFESIIGENAEQFLEECSTKLKPVSCRDVQPGSVVVTLEAASWAELEAANAQLSKEGLELPSFGTLEKEAEAAEAAEAEEKESKSSKSKEAAEMSAEEKKEDLLNPEITDKDVQIVQSIFDKVHEEETKEVEEAKENVDKSLRIVPTAEERSSSNVMVGVGMLVFGFAGSALCIYSWCKASARVKQKITSAASKRLMKQARVGDTQLLVTDIEDLQVGDEVLLGKEKTSIQQISISVTLSEGLAAACKSGESVTPATVTGVTAAVSGSLSKDVAAGEKEILIAKMPQIKKGDALKVGSNEKCTVKSVSKLLMVAPALTAAHMGTKIKKPGDAVADAGEETDPASPTSPTSPAAPAPEEPEAPAPAAETAEAAQ